MIGRTAKDVPAAKALDYVAGWTIANDLSARDVMKRAKVPDAAPFKFDWVSQKCFDGACPLGPWIVPASQIPQPGNLGIKLWVGEELMQDSNTSRMIFDTAEQIEMLSSRVTLRPGDLVLTGTPAGVGMPRGRFLRPGETVRLWIESIGELEHRVACEVPHVVRRAEDPVQRVVVLLGAPAAEHVVAHLALEAVGHVEDHADQLVGGDLHARGADNALFLIVDERLSRNRRLLRRRRRPGTPRPPSPSPRPAPCTAA